MRDSCFVKRAFFRGERGTLVCFLFCEEAFFNSFLGTFDLEAICVVQMIYVESHIFSMCSGAYLNIRREQEFIQVCLKLYYNIGLIYLAVWYGSLVQDDHS